MKTVLIALALTAQAPATAQPRADGWRLAGDPNARLSWMRSYASAGDDWINDIVPLSGDRFLAVGFLNRDDNAEQSARAWRALAAIVRGDGSAAADRHYGERGVNAFWSAREGQGERLAFAGFTTEGGAGGIDALAVSTRADGAVVAERQFGGAGYDRFTSLAPAGDGHVFLGHSQPAGEDRRRLFAVRTDADLDPVWERIIEAPESLGALYIAAAADGGFVVAGGIGSGEGDIVVIKLDGDGRELWRRTIGSAEASDVNHGLALLANGNIVVVGYSRSWGARDNDLLAATLSPTGEVLAIDMLGGAGDDRPILAKADAAGGVVIVGQTASAGAGGTDLMLARLGPDGSFMPGVITLGTAAEDHGTAIHPLGGGDLLVAGYSNAAGGRGGQDAFLARLSAPSWGRSNPAFERRQVRSSLSSSD